METITFNLKRMSNVGLRNPCMRSSVEIRPFRPEPEGVFRDVGKALGFDVEYSEKDARSDFIEGIHFDPENPISL